MDEDKRIVDHSPILEAARADAGREGARMVYMTIGELWRMIHQAPAIAVAEREARRDNQAPVTSAR